ncbi:MAG: 50S ribosomal protein L5 [Candidatus Micrarchaeia archaeon]
MADNPMKNIYLEKVVINIGIGLNENMVENAKALIKKLTDHNSGITVSKRRNPELKLKKGQHIGVVSTIRGKEASEFLKRALDANNNLVSKNAIANNSLNFGVKEYIYFAGVKYDPKVGILGMNVNASFARKGARVAKRKRKTSKPSIKHGKITKEEILKYLSDTLKLKIQES